MNENRAIIVNNISKRYKLYKDKQARLKEALTPYKRTYYQEFYALKNLNLDVKKGEVVGIIGNNGSGKSTLLKLISGITTPSSGYIRTNGKIVPLLELGSGFHPDFTGIENVYFNGLVLGFSMKEMEKRIDTILDFAEIGTYIDQPIRTYSSGMKMRLAFSVSVMIDPDILILDEVLSVGDELFRKKSYKKMEEIFKSGKTILFVSHSAGIINLLCSKAIMLDKGEKILEGPPEMVTKFYQEYCSVSIEIKEKMRNEILKTEKMF